MHTEQRKKAERDEKIIYCIFPLSQSIPKIYCEMILGNGKH